MYTVKIVQDGYQFGYQVTKVVGNTPLTTVKSGYVYSSMITALDAGEKVKEQKEKEESHVFCNMG